MDETILFCFVFLSQILLISWLYPRRVISRRKYVLQNFPPSTHPKLYPQPIEYYERGLRHFARLNLVIVAAGLLIIVALLLGTFRSQHWEEAIVAPFFVVQTFASVYIEFSSLKHHRAMAKAPPPRVRTTELHRRRLVDFVSPAMLVVAALTNIAFIAFVLYYRRFEFPWFTAAGNIAGIAAMLVLFSVLIGISLRGRRPDPYQAPEDRRNSIRLMVQMALAFCIATPVLIAAHLTIKAVFDPNFLEPVFTSLYCQGVAVAFMWPLYRYRVDNVDYDVYRRDARDSTPDASARISSS